MGMPAKFPSPRVALSDMGVVRTGRQPRSRRPLPAYAFAAALGLILVMVFAPEHVPSASAAPAVNTADLQDVSVTGPFVHAVSRDSYSVTEKKVEPPPPPPPPAASASPAAGKAGAPAAAAPDPGSAQAIGHDMVLQRGWGEDQYSCLVSLFNRESGWRVNASNPSGAYGIPQALPGSKMASAGADWQTNPATQIAWGLGYISARYGTPCGAWGHSQSSGWY